MEINQGTDPAPCRFEVRLVTTKAMALARVCGPLDLASAGQLVQQLTPITRLGRLLALDLSLVDFVDSDGIRALLQIDGELSATGGRLGVVLRPGSRVARTLALLRLDQHFEMFDTASEAWLRRATAA